MRKRLLSLALVLAACLSLTVAAQAASTFSDVPSNHWAYNEIQRCCQQGIVNGYANGTFGPGNRVTGAHFAAMLTRMFYPEELAANDGLSSKSWYTPALATADEANLLKGTSKLAGGRSSDWKSSANLALNRYDMAQLLNNVLASKGVQSSASSQDAAKSAIKDFNNIPSGYRSSVLNCYALGVLTGMSNGTFSGSSTMNRAQACAVINRAVNQINNSKTENDTSSATPNQTETLETLDFSDSYKSSKYYTALQNVKLTGDYRQDIMNVAASQLGYCESNSEGKLDGSTPGGGNYSEYGRALGSNGSAWCSEFASWCIRQAKVPTELIHSSLSASVSTFGAPYYSWAQTSFAGGSYTPQPGDLALFAWSGKDINAPHLSHTAIVSGVSQQGSTVYVHVIHGNSNDSVRRSTYTLRASDGDCGVGKLVYFVAPDYGPSSVQNYDPFAEAQTPAAQAALKITPTALTLEVGKTGTVKASLSSGTSVITYTSSNQAIATVDGAGKVTAKAAGTAVVTASATVNGKRLTAQCTVTVTGAQAGAKTPEQLSAEVVTLVNQERAKVGLPALGTLDTLTAAAGIRAPELPKLFEHKRPDGRDCFTALGEANVTGYYTAGENIAAGASTAEGVMNMWMNSPGHKANILQKNFTHIGVACVKSGGGYYWVQMFIGSNTATSPTGTLTMSPTTLTLEAGKTGTVKATASTGNVSITYSSSNAAVASVDSTGKVTAKKAGTAVITGTATIGGKRVTAQCTVTVTAAETPAQSLEQMSADIVRMVNEERAKQGLKALSTMPSLTAAANIRAPELNQSFSHTRPDGRLCDTAFAEAGVTNYYNWGENVAMSSDAQRAMTQWMNSPGHRANILTADFTHIGVACVKNNQGGSYYFVQMFISSRGGSDTTPTGTLSMSPTTLSLNVGETGMVKATASTGSPAISYTSSNTNVAAVDNTGKVTGRGSGTAVITASATIGGKHVTAQCTVTVNTDYKLTMSPTTLSLEAGKTGSVKATYDGGYASIRYTSSDSSVATVDSRGSVKAVSAGTATITASTTALGKDLTATCTVTVTAPAAPSKTPAQLCAEVVTLVNQERAKQGLPALGTMNSLTAAAEIRAPELSRLFEHDRPDGTECFTALDEAGVSGYYTAGENIARGAGTAEAVMNMWMNSPGHRANILSSDFTHIGAAYDNGYWVQMFIGSRSGGSGGNQPGSGDSSGGNQPGGGSSSEDDGLTGGGINVRHTSSSVPSNRITDYYREDWGDGEYFEISVSGSTVSLTGRMLKDRYDSYDHILLAAYGYGNKDYTTFVPGQTYSLSVNVDMDDFGSWYNESHTPSPVTIFACTNYNPNSSSYQGNHMNVNYEVSLILDDSGSLSLKIG